MPKTPKSKRLSSIRQTRAALVEATPRPDGPVLRLQVDRTEDMQAEARAMARAANASVYSPQLLLSKYGSRPLQVGFVLDVLGNN